MSRPEGKRKQCKRCFVTYNVRYQKKECPHLDNGRAMSEIYSTMVVQALRVCPQVTAQAIGLHRALETKHRQEKTESG